MGEIVGRSYFATTMDSQQSLRFLEMAVVRSEDNGYLPNCSFENVVDACTETSAYISYFAVSVDRGEQAETSIQPREPLLRWIENNALFCVSAGFLSA